MTWLIGLGVFIGILYGEMQGNVMLLNMHSFLIVVVGTVGVILSLSSRKALGDLGKLIVHLFKEEDRVTDSDLKSIIKNPENIEKDYYGIVSYARDLSMLGMRGEEFEQLLVFKVQTIINQNMSAISVLRNLGKYPPALGMIGTVLGMIGLFKGLSSGASNQIGTQLAVAMTATFYGLILANLLILPLADRLEAKEEEKRVNLDQLLNVLITVQKQQPNLIAEGILEIA